MRILVIVLGLSFSLLLAACGKGYQINARNLQSANKSIAHIKERLPIDGSMQFEMAYWLTRSQIKDNDEFLKAIDGKTPAELIGMGKAFFATLKASGHKDYIHYENWEQMIAQSAQQ